MLTQDECLNLGVSKAIQDIEPWRMQLEDENDRMNETRFPLNQSIVAFNIATAMKMQTDKLNH